MKRMTYPDRLMKTTRRGWLTAATSLLALPLLTKSGTRAAPESAADPRGIVDHFAALSYPDAAEVPDPDPHEAWMGSMRFPMTRTILTAQEEFIRNELNDMRVRNTPWRYTSWLEEALREIELAHTILHHHRTGRPLTFTYSGGTTPGKARTVLPIQVFKTNDQVVEEMNHSNVLLYHLSTEHYYLEAYCLERLAPRTFRLDRIENPTPLG